MRRDLPELPDAELAVLQQLWERGPATIRQLTDALYPEGTDAYYATVQKLLERLEAKGCHVLHLFDVSGLPEELTPIPLAVLGQLLAHRVAAARGIDPDRPRAIQKVTRTW